MLDKDLEDLLKEDSPKEKRFRLTSAKRKRFLLYVIPVLITISIIGLITSIILDLCLFRGFSIVLLIISIIWFLAYLRINWKIPVNMITNKKDLTIEFVFPFQDMTFTWKDIKDIKTYDHILLDNGKKILLKQVMKAEWDIIYDSLMESDSLVGGKDGKLDEDLLNIMKKKGEKPSETFVIEGISVAYLIQYSILGLLSILCIFLGPTGIIIGFMRGDSSIVRYGLYLCIVSLVGGAIAIFMIRRILHRKRVQIDQNGITCLVGKRVNLLFPWDDTQKCYTREELNGSMEVLGIRSKNGIGYEINHHEVSLKKMKDGFSLIKEYCAFHDIDIQNDLAW